MLKDIKACFDLKNISLAHYLGVSADMMSSVLANRRALQLDQWLEMDRLHKALDFKTPLDELEFVGQVIARESEQTEKTLTLDAKKIERNLARKRQALARMKKLRGDVLRGLHASQLLLETDMSAEKRKWLEMKKRHLDLRLKENNARKLRLLEADIIGLEARLGHIKDIA